jgi:hypothetical protein
MFGLNFDELPDLQRDVQRMLGRCMVRLQQYERLLKVMLANQELAGAANELEKQRVARTDDYASSSLGTLVKELFVGYVIVAPIEGPVLDESKLISGALGFGFRINMQMSAERVAQTKASLKELVSLRNDLVHHFIERFNIWTVEGCDAASRHLIESYVRIDERYEELRLWATHMVEASRLAAAVTQSDAFQNLILHKIARDGAVDWAHADIIHGLITAAGLFAVEGWTPLKTAVDWMSKHYQEEVPEKYLCRSWAQVLNDSQLFQLHYRISESKSRCGWYRVTDSSSIKV